MMTRPSTEGRIQMLSSPRKSRAGKNMSYYIAGLRVLVLPYQILKIVLVFLIKRDLNNFRQLTHFWYSFFAFLLSLQFKTRYVYSKIKTHSVRS